MAGRMFDAVGGRVALVGMLLLSGCWLQVGNGPGHTRFNPVEEELTRANVASLDQAWSVEVPGNLSEPIVSGGRVFVSHTIPQVEARVRALDVASGSTLWDQLLVGAPPGGFTMLLNGAPVAFVDDNLWTGSLVNIYTGPSQPYCSFQSHFLDPATGERIGGTGGYPSAFVALGGAVARTMIPADSAGCTNLSGTTLQVGTHSAGDSFAPLWSAPLRTAGAPIPTFTDGQVIVAYGSTVEAYEAPGCGTTTCSPTWTVALDASAASAPVAETALTAGPVFVLAGGNLLALERATGAELWRAPLDGTAAGLALADDTVYVTSNGEGGGGHGLQAFDADGCGAATCEPSWAATLGGTGVDDPVVGGGVVYVTNGQEVLAFDADGCGAATCEPLVTVEVGSPGALALAQGHLFVASAGRLTALAPVPGG